MPRFPVVFDSRSSFFAPKPYGNACYAGCGGPREECRSVPRGGVKKKKTDRSRTKRERCRSVPRGGVKKKGSVENRESGVALGHGVALKKKN